MITSKLQAIVSAYYINSYVSKKTNQPVTLHKIILVDVDGYIKSPEVQVDATCASRLDLDHNWAKYAGKQVELTCIVTFSGAPPRYFVDFKVVDISLLAVVAK